MTTAELQAIRERLETVRAWDAAYLVDECDDLLAEVEKLRSVILQDANVFAALDRPEQAERCRSVLA